MIALPSASISKDAMPSGKIGKDAMTGAQQRWMDAHPEYEGMSSWRGPYKEAGILSPTGEFVLGSPLDAHRIGCMHIGIRSFTATTNSSDERT